MVGDWVWMTSHRRRRGQVAKLQPTLVGPYCVTEVMPNHTYKVKRLGQVLIQNEARLNPYRSSPDAAGQAPPLLKPMHHPTTRGRARVDRELEVILQRLQEAADEPADRSQAAPPLVEPADTPAHLK